MPYCPNNHGEKRSNYCDECGAKTVEMPLSSGDSVKIRSPESRADATSNVYIQGIQPSGRPELVKCSWCGRHNEAQKTFDCTGGCKREHLCEEHYDPDYHVCKQCARSQRKEDEKVALRWRQLESELNDWQSRARTSEQLASDYKHDLQTMKRTLREAEKTLERVQKEKQQVEKDLAKTRLRTSAAESKVVELSSHLDSTLAERDKEHQALRQSQKQVETLRAHEAHYRKRTEEIERLIPELETRLTETEQRATNTKGEVHRLNQRIMKQQRELMNWRQRANAAEVRLEAIEQEKQAILKADRERKQRERQTSVLLQAGIKLIKIPAGEFLFGEGKIDIHIPEYFLARCPVTVKQFTTFADEIGYLTTAEREGWSYVRIGTYWSKVNGASWRHPQGPKSDLKGKELHPVTQISWHDACAFCDWAGLRLPSEREWEKGARGGDGREYPWGNDWRDGSCNNKTTNIGTTSGINRFVSGASPYDLLDMAGNVFEWCVDHEKGQKTDRILRGGSWRSGKGAVRVVYRVSYAEDFRCDDFGFRPAFSHHRNHIDNVQSKEL